MKANRIALSAILVSVNLSAKLHVYLPYRHEKYIYRVGLQQLIDKIDYYR